MDSDQDSDPPELGRLRDTRVLWRVATWGTLAAMAVAGVYLIIQTDAGSERLKLALTLSSDTPAAVAAPSASKETDALRLETQRLRAEVRQLADDRDQLNARIVSLESSLNDMTGSIKRELALLAAAPAPKTPPPTIDAPDSAPPRSATDVAGTGGSETRSVSAGDPRDQSEAKFQRRIDLGPDSAVKPNARPKTPAEPSAKPESPQAGAPGVPLPPVRIASAPANEPASHPDKGELGVEIGGARTMEILHARWAAVKANFGPLIEGMHPLVVHDRRPGMSIPYRLIVGPLPNGAAAAQLCQRLAAARVSCRTTRYAGDALAQQ